MLNAAAKPKRAEPSVLWLGRGSAHTRACCAAGRAWSQQQGPWQSLTYNRSRGTLARGETEAALSEGSSGKGPRPPDTPNPQNLSRLSPNSDDQTKTSEDHGRPGPEDGREGRRWVQDGEEGRSAAESRGAKVDVLGELTPRRRRPLGGADPLPQPLPRRRARDGAGWH